MLWLFVYGTLKRGHWNHEIFCRGALEICKATVRGRLYEGPGFPFLDLPDDEVLATGTDDPLADVATQRRMSAQVGSWTRPRRETTGQDFWGAVHGDLLAFDDAERRLPSIDRLEGFRPGQHCLYRRVLVAVESRQTRELAWAYAIADTSLARVPILSGRWPE